MLFISHRGNVLGPDKKLENNPVHISELSKKYNFEIDLWALKDKIFIGHDTPEKQINPSFFNKKMWIHCKNLEAVNYISNTKFNWFWHENDKMTLTSKGKVWCFPEVYLPEGITVMLEYKKELPKIKGICTDFLFKYL